MVGTANHFPAKNALDFGILHTVSKCLSVGGTAPGLAQRERVTRSRINPQHGRRRCLDADTNFRLPRQRCRCFCFTKRPLRWVWLYDRVWTMWTWLRLQCRLCVVHSCAVASRYFRPSSSSAAQLTVHNSAVARRGREM